MKSNLSFLLFSFVLSPVSLVHGRLCAEASHPALQSRVPSVKRPCLTTQLGGPCAEALRTTRQSKMAAAEPVQRDTARDTAIQDGGGRPCAEALRPALGSGVSAVSCTIAPHPGELPAPPCWQEPYKAAPPTGVYSAAQAHTSGCFERKMKLSFASEPNLVLFYWLQGHQAGGPLLEPSSGGSVTNLKRL